MKSQKILKPVIRLYFKLTYQAKRRILKPVIRLYFIGLHQIKWKAKKFPKLKRFVILLNGLFWAVLFPIYIFLRRRASKDVFDPNFPDVLIIVPDDYDPSNPNLNGSTKVTAFLTMDLSLTKLNFDVIPIGRRFLYSIHGLLGRSTNRVKIMTSEYAIISIPGSSGILTMYLSVFARKQIVHLSHNAELLHRIEWAKKVDRIGLKFRYLYKACVGLISDFLAVNSAFRILTLSHYEQKVYWNRLTWKSNRRKIEYFPYCPPNIEFDEKKQEERNLFVIMGTFSKSAGEERASRNFIENGADIKVNLENRGYSLISTGNGSYFDFCHLNLGFLDEDELNKVNMKTLAILVPIDWGWGFKTKVADALYSEQRVFMSKILAKRYSSWEGAIDVIDDWGDFGKYLRNNPAKKPNTGTVCEYQRGIRNEVLLKMLYWFNTDSDLTCAIKGNLSTPVYRGQTK